LLSDAASLAVALLSPLLHRLETLGHPGSGSCDEGERGHENERHHPALLEAKYDAGNEGNSVMDSECDLLPNGLLDVRAVPLK